MQFKHVDPKTFKATGAQSDYEIERSLLRDDLNSVIVCSTLSVESLALAQKTCNNIESFFANNKFFQQYSLHDCYLVHVFDQHHNLLDTVVDNSFEKFCRALCKYLFHQSYGTYEFSFLKYKALKKEEEGFVLLEKISDLNSAEMLIAVTQSKPYREFERKLPLKAPV